MLNSAGAFRDLSGDFLEIFLGLFSLFGDGSWLKFFCFPFKEKCRKSMVLLVDEQSKWVAPRWGIRRLLDQTQKGQLVFLSSPRQWLGRISAYAANAICTCLIKDFCRNYLSFTWDVSCDFKFYVLWLYFWCCCLCGPVLKGSTSRRGSRWAWWLSASHDDNHGKEELEEVDDSAIGSRRNLISWTESV